MTKDIDIGVVQLQDNTVRESIKFVERAIEEKGFAAMEEVTLHTLFVAVDNPQVQEGLQMLDHKMVADEGVLQILKANTMQRKFEIQDHTFFFELLKRLERNGKRVFLLGETKEIIAERVQFMLAHFPKLQIAGTGTLEECIGTDEALVNHINGLSPDAIISLLPSPTQEIFLLEHKDKIFASFWYGMGEINPSEGKSGFVKRFHQWKMRRDLEKILWKK